jgi:hypothetical protein
MYFETGKTDVLALRRPLYYAEAILSSTRHHVVFCCVYCVGMRVAARVVKRVALSIAVRSRGRSFAGTRLDCADVDWHPLILVLTLSLHAIAR